MNNMLSIMNNDPVPQDRTTGIRVICILLLISIYVWYCVFNAVASIF